MFSLTPTRWDRELANPERFVDRMFKDLLGEQFLKPVARGFTPAIDLTESDDEFIVRAEVPGVASGDLEIDYDKETLTLRGEKRSEQTKETGDGARWIESRWGSFSRSVRLNAPVDAEQIQADLVDGVLTVRVPKAEQAKPRKIEVKTTPLPNEE